MNAPFIPSDDAQALACPLGEPALDPAAGATPVTAQFRAAKPAQTDLLRTTP